jgi:hypothetical protein
MTFFPDGMREVIGVSLLPAYRAARVDPLQTLSDE